MTPAYIHHVTLTTGHSVRSPRAAVAGRVLDLVAPWLDRALLADDPTKAPPIPLPVPELAEFSAHIFTTPGGLVVTVYGPDNLSMPPAMPDPVPLVHFAVARRERNAQKLWNYLLQAAPCLGPPPTMPSVPWLAVALYPSLRIFPDASNWLGGFERAVAWAWIERAAN